MLYTSINLYRLRITVVKDTNEEESIAVPSHTTEDVRVAANEDQTEHLIKTDAMPEKEYTQNEMNLTDTIDDYTDRWYTEKEVPGKFNEDLYDSVKEAVQESAQTVVSSMEKSVMSFTKEHAQETASY